MSRFNKIVLVIFISDGTYTGFKGIHPSRFTLIPASLWKCGLLWSCGLILEQWLSRISHLLAFCLNYGVGSMSAFLTAAGQLFHKMTPVIPTLKELNDKLKYESPKYGRIKDIIEGVTNKVDGLLMDTGNFFHVRQGVDLMKLATSGKHLIFEVPRFVKEFRHIVIGYVMLWFYLYLQSIKSDTLYVFILDEAYSLINKPERTDAYSVGNPFTEMIMEGRKQGMGFIYVSQELATVQSSILANVNTKLFHKPTSGKEAEEIRKYIVGSAEQKSALMALEKGKVLMQSSKERQAILVNVREYHG